MTFVIEPTSAVIRLREPAPPPIQPGRFAPKPKQFAPQSADPAQPDEVEHHTDAAHEALFKHDTAVGESHKAITLGQHATSLDDRVAAKTRLFDAAKGHKHAARQISRLADQLRDEPKRKGAAAMAKRLATSHRDAAQSLEDAALGGSLLKARKTVGVAEKQASMLSGALGGARSSRSTDVLAESTLPGARGVDVGIGEVVTAQADGLSGVAGAQGVASSVVDALGDQFPVRRVAAQTVRTAIRTRAGGVEIVAGVVHCHPVGDGTDELQPPESVGVDVAVTGVEVSVPASALRAEPQPALITPGHVHFGQPPLPGRAVDVHHEPDGTRNWAAWDAEHPWMKHPREKHGGVGVADRTHWEKSSPEHQGRFRRGFAASLRSQAKHESNPRRQAGLLEGAQAIDNGAEPHQLHALAEMRQGGHQAVLHHIAERFANNREAAASGAGADMPQIPADHAHGKFYNQDKEVVASAVEAANKMDHGQVHHGRSEMSDEEYRAHRNHVEYEITRHGSNDLERSPFSSHNSEDRADGVEGRYTDARKKLHEQILREYDERAASVPNEHKAVIMGGLGGAGKSSILRHEAQSPDSVAGKLGIKYDTYDRKGEGVGEPKNFVTINPDDIKERMAELGAIPQIDELSPMEASVFAHEEASQLAERVAQRLQNQGTNVIHDITLNSVKSGQKRILGDPARNVKGLRDQGYHTTGVMVDVSTDQSMRNAETRHRGGQDRFDKGIGAGGRYVPSDLIRTAKVPGSPYRSKNRAAFEELKSQGLFDHSLTIDNENFAGQLVNETGHREEAAVFVRDDVPEPSPLTAAMQAYHDGKMSFPELTATIVHHPFGTPTYYTTPGRTEMDTDDQDWVQPGTWSEVVHGADSGLITDDELSQIDAALGEVKANEARGDIEPGALSVRDWKLWDEEHRKWHVRQTGTILGETHTRHIRRGGFIYGAHIHNADTRPHVTVTRTHSSGGVPQIIKMRSDFANAEEARAYAERMVAEDTPPTAPPRIAPPRLPRAPITMPHVTVSGLPRPHSTTHASSSHITDAFIAAQERDARDEESDARPKVSMTFGAGSGLIEAGAFDTRSWALFDALRPHHPRAKGAHEIAESPHKPIADPFGWKPVMTPAEADAWLAATGSKVKTPLFHGTAPWNVPGILRSGFRTRPTPKTTSNAQYYGQGAYVTSSRRLANKLYAGGDDASTLETRVAVTHPATTRETKAIIDRVKARKPSVEQVPGMIREEAEREGFDAIVVDYYDPRMGGEGEAKNWIIFDPHKIVVVKK